ncbi:FAD-binding protein [Actinosynnema sp. NPDC050436]|uniref:FAD-binding protein n=1 Tax=Actinosynnema sp. NPDC050436 TaxID=3155659 RepID=UPI0033C50CFA
MTHHTWYFDLVNHRLSEHHVAGFLPFPVLDGIVTTAESALRWAVDDFGRGTDHPRPLGVARPHSVRDVAAVLRFAHEHGILVVPRAEGHSTGGQAQAPGGLVLDMRGLTTVHHVTRHEIIVDAGARWSDVLEATLPAGAAPPVLTDYLDLSVGGTLSVGGISGATHHHGLQTDNITELDVVTPDGTHVTCSPTHQPELFDALRAGRGRRGVIVRAALRLVAAYTHARLHRLRYDDIGTFLTDHRALMTEGRFHHLEGQIKAIDGTWVPLIDGVSYFTPPTAPSEERLLGGLSDRRDALEITDFTYHGFQNRLAEDVSRLRAAGPWQQPHPWINLFLPDHAAEHIVSETLTELTAQDIGDTGHVLLYPILRARITTPQFRLPDTSTAFLFALLKTAPSGDTNALARMLAHNLRLKQRVVAVGGTVYVDDIAD